MAILTVEEAAEVCRADSDHEYLLLQSYVDAASIWINRVTEGEFGLDAPEDIKLAARMLVAHWHDNRGSAMVDRTYVIPFGVRMLVANHRSFAHGSGNEIG